MITKELLTKSVFFYSVFWGIGILLLWFRPRIEIFWKIIGTVIFLLTLLFFKEELVMGWQNLAAGWYISVLSFLKEAMTLVFMSTFFLWPVALVIIFYKADDMGAEKLLKFMSVLSLVLWILFLVYHYFNAGIDKVLYENMQKMIPGGN